jgi:sugar fermentation stimulation protein A
MIKLFNVGQLVKGKVIKRPSSTCKTPYVADVELEDGSIVLAHTTSLGCCGLADKDANVMMTHVENSKNVCKYKILISVVHEKGETEYIGIDTSLPERIVKYCLENNCIKSLSNLSNLKTQATFLNSRFDFAGEDENGTQFILEVKNTPLADYVDCLSKEKKKMDLSKFKYNEKIAYFPDGYRKKVKDTVSPRALKHAQELTEIKKTTNKRAILCYVIQRTDVSSFQPSNIDPIYKQAVIEAYQNGVEIMPLVIKWCENGDCYLKCEDLRVNI